MKNLVKIAAVSAIALVPAQAMAATGDVIFNGTVTHTCTITVGAPGTLAADASFQTLTGTGGSADIVATGNGFDISVDTPTLTKPAADTSAETLAASFSTSGATSVSGTDSSATQDLNNGTTAVTIGMTATKSGSDVFEAGSYTGTVVLRCE